MATARRSRCGVQSIMKEQEVKVLTSVKFSWTINNFSKLSRDQLYSDTFFTGPYPWRIGIYPKRSFRKLGTFVDVHLYPGPPDDVNFPVGGRYANVKLSLVNQLETKSTEVEERENVELNQGDKDNAACSLFIDLTKIHGFLVNDTCIIVAEVSVNDLGVLDHNHPRFFLDFKGLCKIEKEYAEVLEESCSKHPSLIESHRKRKRSQRFTECSFTALGKLLLFLETKKVKDMMSYDACKELQDLWEEVEIRFDDLSWLEPHVQSALTCLEKAAKVEKLKVDVADLEEKSKTLKAEAIAIDADLEKTKKELAMAEEDFDLDDELGYGIP
ncbi:hypothetical protein PIB30_053832 [Stylosanthes scabra]|uniref:MATH domain-containing protein n=1 Tax=Stylosanthes scabra TaxID=79078 RepID=A0ABU6TJ50_9FABA|nr:hypothetical protein [Stylosanthes scabra]